MLEQHINIMYSDIIRVFRALDPFGAISDSLLADLRPPVPNTIFTEKTHPTSANIKETDASYIIEAEVPGYSKEDISIDVKNYAIVITAKHEDAVEVKQDNTPSETDDNAVPVEKPDYTYIRKEISSSSIRRVFNFQNRDVDMDAISAKCENGMLYVTIPKKNGSTRSIPIE